MILDTITIPSITKDEIKDQFFTVMSVELGNTTIKSIITTTNIKTNKNFQIIKLVKLTRDIRLPYDNEEVFGHTIWDKPLSKEAIEETITELILESLKKSNLTQEDLDFVVRSTGVVALSGLSKEVGSIIKALSDGCLNANIKPSQMMAPFSINNIPEHIRKYSFFNSIKFDGSVVSVSSPKVTGMIANEMEGELVTAGIKLASKESNIDYRNPVVSIDMGTTLAGQVINNIQPYANLICNYIGLAGGIGDIILREIGIINSDESTIDLEYNQLDISFNEEELYEHTLKLHEFIDIMEVTPDYQEFGLVAVDGNLLKNSDVKVIGSRINNKDELIKIFNKLVNTSSKIDVLLHLDDLYAYLIKRLIDETKKLNRLPKNATLGITGRAGTSGLKTKFIQKYLEDTFENIIFVEDGLSLGAVMMARCMNSLGSPINPVGGSKGGMCIMQQRITNQNVNINKKS